MRKSILSSFEYSALQKPIEDFYNQFAAASETGNTLSQSQIQDLQRQYNQIITNAGLQFDQLQKLTGIDLTTTDATASGNSLSGAIKGITEQQAELLAGQFGGLRLTAIDQLNMAKSSLDVLNQIANNTSLIKDTNTYLRKFDTEGIKMK